MSTLEPLKIGKGRLAPHLNAIEVALGGPAIDVDVSDSLVIGSPVL